MNHNQPTKRIFSSMTFLLFFSLAMTLLTAVNINATTTTVSSVAALQTAINNANTGDVLILANGAYLNNTLSISKSNITVKAATSGGVFLNGTNDINISGSHVVFSGFQFTSGNIGTGTVIRITGSYNVVTQLNFSDYYAAKYIQVNDGTQYNEITFCNLEKKPAAAAIGCTIQISTSPTVPGYHKIRYCSFQNYFGIGGDNGNEPIRIGLGAEYLNKSRTIVENCYFNNTGLGDSETVSVKCQENVIRYCTFTNQQDAMLVFRNGDNNVAYGNFFINAGGIRVKEANNIYCYNNYFQNSGVGSTADAVTYVYVAPLVPPTTTSPRTLNLDNINFIHNTFYNCGNIDLGGTGATNNTWANNIFKKSTGSIFTNANSGTTWAGNFRSGSSGITIATGMTSVDPLLTLNSEGFYGLASNSPAINAASSSYPAILDLANIDDDPTLVSDISGQIRVGIKDVGADEYSTATTLNRPLAVSDAGPNYLGGPSIVVSTQPSASSICARSNTSFTASSTSTLSPTTVQWQRSANSGSTWTNITANLDAATTYSDFTTDTLVLTGSSSAINNYQYKAVFTNTIGSVDSNAVALTVVTTALPGGSATKAICGDATVASLTGYIGTALQWYAALTGGIALATNTALTTGNYYVSQTLNGCESTRKTVAVTVTSPAPTASSLLLCSGSTVADLTATGSSLKWYAAATAGSQLSNSVVLTSTTYYVSQTISSCESSRTSVVVEVYVPATLPVLNADGPGNTYELITSVLAPCQGVAAVEAPDMLDGTVIGTHPSFGRHIAEVMDADLGKYVFEFYSHLAEDNDITGGLNRERVEIKTYGGSTDNLKGVLGETVTYKWRFKVPTGFQPSNNFTHIHQIKAVDGDDSSPIFTLTPRYGTPNTLQLIYTQDENTSTDTKAEVNLSLFENTWVEVVETIKIGTGTAGSYAITIKKVSDGTTILSYSSNAIQTIRTAATDPATTGKVANSFIRPKWGIYRSLLDSGKLRDDSMRFSDISISEIVPPTAVLTANTNGTVSVSGVAVNGVTVTVKFPDNTTATAVAGAAGAYGPITSGVLLTSGNVVVTYVSSGNTSPETIFQFTALPVVSDQLICTSGTVADLTSTGTLVKWYAAASAGTVLATSTALATGTYYVTQTVNGLESARKAVLVTINTTPAAPTASAQALCNSNTVANLVATGTALKWYTASTGGSALATSTILATGTYYVSQTLNSCESTRTSVAVTVTTTAAPTASAQAICNSGTVANLTATGTLLKWYTASTGGSALATSTALTARTYYVSQTLNSCESSRVSSAVTIPVCVLSKQVIAEQPYHDGGFEGQSGVLGTTTQSATNNFWKSSTSASVPTVVGVFNTSAPRSGNTYLTQTLNATTPAANQAGHSRSAFGANATTNVAKWVTFYYKPTPGVSQTTNNLQIRGGYVYSDNTAATQQLYGTLISVPTSTSYTKYSRAVAAPTNLGTSNTQIALYLKSVAGGVVSVDVDDIVVYDGTAEDVTAPNAPTTATVSNITATGLDVNWTQPAAITSPTTEASNGIDGGGYVVVRYASNPNADNDPNVNGIYAVGNTITNGTGSLTGTVVYIGTGTTFTDSSLALSTSYYYKVYAVDKAFNYSAERQVTGTTTGPLASPVATAATTITADGFTANWGAVANATSYNLYVYNANTQSNIVAWTFPTTWVAAAGYAPIADISNINNTSTTITQSSGTVTAGEGSGGVGTYSISAASWYINPNKYWEAQVNTTGYRNIKLSSKVYSTAPKDFKLQYKIGVGGTYVDVDNGAFICSNNWTTGLLNNLTLPAACDNASSVYLRWINYTNIDYNTGVAMTGGTARLDDIYVTGGALTSESGYPVSVSGTSTAVSGLSIGTYYYDVIASGSGYTSSAKSNLITAIVSIPQASADYKSVGTASTSSAINWQYYDGISWLSASSAPTSANSITVTSGNVVTLASDFTVGAGKTFTVNGTLDLSGHLLSGAGSFTLSSGATLKLGDNVSMATGITTTTSTLNVAANYIYDGTIAQNTASLPTDTMTGNVTVSNAAGVTMAAALKINTPGTLEVTSTGKLLFGDGNVVSAIIGSGTFTYSGTGNFTAATGSTLSITSSKGISGTGAGCIRNTGTRSFATGVNYIFAKNDGVNAITMGTSFGTEISATTGINNLTINNSLSVYLPGAISANLGEFTPDVDVTVNGVLNFVSGKLIANNGINSVPQTTGTKMVTIGASGSITGAGTGTGWVIGNLKKVTSLRTSPSFNYAIGDAVNYTPLALTFSGTTSAAGGLTARINAGDIASIAGSGIDSSKSVNRNWTLTNDALAGFGMYSAAFTYASADNDAGTTPANYVVRKYENLTWSSLTTSGTSIDSAATASGITSFGDFAIGEGTLVAPTATITAGGATTFCSGGSITLTANTGTGLTYLWSPGGATTSSITATASGSYTVKVTSAAGETTSVPTVVTVNALPTIIGSLSVCKGSTTSLTVDGTADVTTPWTSTSTNVATVSNLGVVTGVTAGTSLITYKNSNGCTITATVTVNTCNNLKIILKLDDFYSESGSSTSTPTLDYLVTKKVKAGIGFVASRNDASALSVFSSYLNQTNTSGDKLFEVWHHGFDHIRPEFDGTSYNYQKSHFEDANQLILDGLRVQMHSFGAPYNGTDATTNTVISENSNYKVTMFQNPEPNASTGILNLTNRVNMESATGVPSYSEFIANYNLYKNTYTDYMVLQGHPFAWTTPEKLAEFSQIIDFLIAEGVQFVTPFEYYLGLNPTYPRPSTAQTISFSALSNKAKGDTDFSPGATSTSGLTVTYNSSNPAVATIINGSIHIVGSGSTIITASQIGDATYKSANYVSQTLTVTSKEFRSLASGNWNTTGTWQVSDVNGAWTTATTLPTALNNVYIQSGHTVTVNAAEAYSNDLHTNTAGALAISGTYNVNVNGKIRAYTGLAEISTSNGVYVGSNTTTMVSAMISTGSTGVLKFVGSTRNITNTGEWAGSGTTNNVSFALDSEAIGTLATSIKFKTITISSGAISSSSTISVGSTAGNGNLIISSGAKLISSRTYTTGGSQVITYSSTAKCGSVTVEGTLELTGAAPVIDCTSFGGTGTVMYSGGSQNLLSAGAGIGTQIATYSNLTVSGTGAKTLPTTINITVSGALNFQETGVNIITGTNTLTLGTAGSIAGAGTGWVVGNLIKQTASNASPSFVYTIGDATNYTPIALTFTGNTAAAGSIAASTTTGDHSQVASSGINGSKSVNRIWSLTNNGINGFTNYSAAFTYADADNDASTTPANYSVRLYSAPAWTVLTTSGTIITTSATASGITGFGDFAIGECIPTTTGSEAVSACGSSYTWPTSGEVYTSSGTYTKVVGCNTASLTLTLTPNTTIGSETVSACGTSYTWPTSGEAYTSSGTYTKVTECNTATLTLTLSPATTTGSETVLACGSAYTWPTSGEVYTSSGTYTKVTGCNTATLILTLTPNTTIGSESVSVCGSSYTWITSGETYTSSGTYTKVVGCNTATLILVLTPATNHTTAVSAFNTYTWNGVFYTSSGIKTGPTVNCITELLDLTITTAASVLPTADTTYNFCTGAKVSALTAVIGAGVKAYATSTGVVALGDIALTGTTSKPVAYYLTEPTANGESATRVRVYVIINALPATPSALVLTNEAISSTTAVTAVGLYVGTNTPFKLTATAAGTGLTYKWTLPFGVVRTDVTGATTDNSTTSDVAYIYVKFTGTDLAAPPIMSMNLQTVNGSATPLVINVQTVNASGCTSLIKASASLTRLLPTAPSALALNNGLNTTAITTFAKYMGSSTVLRLSAAAAATATSYLWELPTGVNRMTALDGGTITTDLTSTDPFIYVNFAGVTKDNTVTNSTVAALTKVLRFGVKSVNGVGSSVTANATATNPSTSSTAKLLTLTAVAPAAPSSLAMNNGLNTTAITVISKMIGQGETVKLLAATSALASSYAWELPSCVTRVNDLAGSIVDNTSTSTDPFIYVKFNGTNPAAGSIYFGVTAVNGVGSSVTSNSALLPATTSTAKLLKLATVVPAAPSSLAMNNGLNTTAITVISKMIGQGETVKLLAATSALATSYAWELPSCVTRVTDLGGSTADNTSISTDPFIFVKFTANATALPGSIYFGVTAVNGVGSIVINNSALVPATASTAKLLKLVTAVPAGPTTLVLNDMNSATPTTAVTVVSKYVGSSTTLKLTAAASVLANTYSWELPSCVTRVTDLAGLTADNTSTSTDPFIYVKFNGTTPVAGSIYFGVKAVNSVGSSITANTGATIARTDKLLAVTGGLPVVVATVSGALSVCNRAEGFSYTITAPVGATSYIITAPAGSVVSSTNGVASAASTSSTNNVLTTSDLTFKVIYNGTAAFSTTDKSLVIKSANAFGPCLTTKALALTKQTNCNSIPTSTVRLAASSVTEAFNVIAYPNPSLDVFTLDIKSSGKGKATTGVQVYDMTGRLIEQRQVESNSVEIGNNYPTGVYNVIVNQAENTKTLRVIKK